MASSRRLGASGVTLVELMISVAILSIGILGFVGAFTYITKAIHVARTRTLSTNLAQEKIETLKNLSYYELLITSATSQDNNFSPAVVYDTSNYPPETIVIGGITFTRYTFVALAQFVSDTVSTVTANFPDTGLKQITTTVVWNDRNTWKSWTLNSLLENPNVAPLDSTVQGYVYESASPWGNGLPMGSAIVQVEGFPDLKSLTNSSGYYAFQVYHGSYNIVASSAGFWGGESGETQAIEGTVTTASQINLSMIATGTISGVAWISTNVVISQFVADSVTVSGQYLSPANCSLSCTGTSNSACGNGISLPSNTCKQDLEYVELFNPTTSEFSVTAPGGNPSYLSLYYSGSASNGSKDAVSFPISVMLSTYVAANHYYLLANASFFMLNGQWMHADAAYTGSVFSNDLGGCGSLSLNNALNGSYISTIDEVAWFGSPCDPGRPVYGLGHIILTASGVPAGDQLVRVSTPGASAAQIAQLGRAYNSGGGSTISGIGGNEEDFVYPDITGYTGINFQPYHENTSDNGLAQHLALTTAAVVAGIPAFKSYVSASDPFSGSTTALTMYITSGALSLPYAPFYLVGVTTSIGQTAAACAGQCWLVDIASGSYSVEIATVIVSQNLTTMIPNTTTYPTSLSPANLPDDSLILSTGGYVKGNVSDVNGIGISGVSTGLQVTVGGNSKTLNSNGDYFIAATTGVVTVIANPKLVSPYVQSIALPTVNAGQITIQDFTLVQGGMLQAYVTAGTTPLPNYTFVATQGGNEMGSCASDTSGMCYITNVATGTYTVAPTLDQGKSSNPVDNEDVVLLAGTTYTYAGQFTITGAMGTITGNVKLSNNLVTSGALILASTTPWSSSYITSGGNPPPVIVGSSAPALSPMYAISSLADGTYSLAVRGGSSSYSLLVYIPSVDPSTGRLSISTASYNNAVGVGAGYSKTYNISQ